METRKLSELKVNPNNPRGEVVVDVALQELAQSILEQGVLQPILITPDGTIVAGHRRAKASEIAGLKTIPVVVREMSESQQIQIMLIENLQREDLTALQTAKAYRLLCDKGLSIRDIAKAVGYRPESVSRHLNILQLPKELHSCFDGEYAIPLGGIKYLLKLEPAEQLRIGKLAAEKRWLVSSIALAVAQKRTPQPARQKVKTEPLQWREMLSLLEDIDEQLDNHKEFRPVQSLLRKAITAMIEIAQKKRSKAA